MSELDDINAASEPTPFEKARKKKTIGPEVDMSQTCPKCNKLWPGPGHECEPADAEKPHIVCLCGSTRFMDAFFDAGWKFTLEGKIVLSVGVCKHATDHGAEALGQDVVDRLDELHLRKIDLADSVFVLNVGGYIGESTAAEIRYAEQHDKPIGYLESCGGAVAEPANAMREHERSPLRRQAEGCGSCVCGEDSFGVCTFPERATGGPCSGYEAKAEMAEASAIQAEPYLRPLNACPGCMQRQDIIDRQAEQLKAKVALEDMCMEKISNLRKQLKAKDEAMWKYGRHRSLCKTLQPISGPCNCGFEQALKET